MALDAGFRADALANGMKTMSPALAGTKADRVASKGEGDTSACPPSEKPAKSQPRRAKAALEKPAPEAAKAARAGKSSRVSA